MAPFIRLTELTKRFDEVVAVDNLSLDIEKGELFCLLGASGCGKSTLLRMLAGFEQPSAGRIEIDDEQMTVRYQDSLTFTQNMMWHRR